jgi:hypothetical protein
MITGENIMMRLITKIRMPLWMKIALMDVPDDVLHLIIIRNIMTDGFSAARGRIIKIIMRIRARMILLTTTRIAMQIGHGVAL